MPERYYDSEKYGCSKKLLGWTFVLIGGLLMLRECIREPFNAMFEINATPTPGYVATAVIRTPTSRPTPSPTLECDEVELNAPGMILPVIISGCEDGSFELRPGEENPTPSR